MTATGTRGFASCVVAAFTANRRRPLPASSCKQGDNLEKSLRTVQCMRPGIKGFPCWYLQPGDRALGLPGTCGATVEMHQSQIRDENNGAGESVKQCELRRGSVVTKSGRITRVNAVWLSCQSLSRSGSPVCLCAKLLRSVLGDGNMKGWRKEDSAAGGEIKHEGRGGGVCRRIGKSFQGEFVHTLLLSRPPTPTS